MGRALSHVGHFCVRFRWSVVVVWLILAIGLTAFTTNANPTTTNDVALPGTGSQEATDLLTAEFPPQQNGSSPAVYHVTSGKLNDKGPNQQAITNAYKAIKAQPEVSSVTNPFKQPQAGLVSKDGTYAMMPILLKTPNNKLTVKEAKDYYNLAVTDPEKQGIKSAVGGPIGNTLFVVDTGPSERLGMLAAAFILAISFASLVAMGLPLISAVIGLLVGIASIWFLGVFLEIPTIGTTLARMIGLGVGIDYALFMVYRHRRFITEKGYEPHRAAVAATATAGGAIIFAGSTVVLALLSLQVAGIPFIAGLGYACAGAVAFAVISAITFLPALLAIVGSWVTRVRVPFLGRTTTHPIARRWAALITGHRYTVAVLAMGLLIPLVLPVQSMVLGQQDDAVSPKSTSQRQAFDLVSQGFGPGYNGPLVVAMSLDPKAKPSQKYENQYNEATSLQNQLTAEQQSLTQQQAELEQQQDALEASADELQAEGDSLQAEQASLEAEAADLQQQEAQLKAEGARLQEEAQKLGAEVEQAVLTEARIARDLARNRIAQRVLKRRISHARNPLVRAELEKRLDKRKKERRTLRKELKRNTEKLQSLKEQGKKLDEQAQALAKEAQALAQQGEALAQEGEALSAQATELEQQQAALEAESASLQEWGNELQQQSNEAKKQEKQAKQLQNELTKELTKAGGDARGTDPRIVQMQDALAKPSEVDTVVPPDINKAGTAVILSVIAKTQPANPKTADLVQQLRDKTIPPATVPGEDVYVGGSTASNVDLATLITEKLALVIATVVLLSSLLLLIAFRSLLVPLQAAIANTVAAAASFGVVTVVFQWGWGLDWIGLETSSGSVPVVSYVPLMMFAALFGLSMDYQVFVISTIQNEAVAGIDPRQAVKDGVMNAGRVVVTAALIMMSVFGSFVLNDDSVIKQFGVGLTVAVALAATLVLTWTPAALTIFGRWTWALPHWLDRILPNLDLEGRQLEAKWEAEDAAAAAGEQPAAEDSATVVSGSDILPGGAPRE